MGIYYLKNRDWKGFGLYCLVMGLAGVISVVCFPYMIQHMFGMEKHSKSTVDNLFSNASSEYCLRLKNFWNSMDRILFSGILKYILVAVFVGILIFVIRYIFFQKRHFRYRAAIKRFSEKYLGWCLVFIPFILYFVVVSRIATYVVDRYIHPVYALLFLLGMWIIYNLFKVIKCLGHWKIVLFAFMAVVILYGWYSFPGQYLYLDGEEAIRTAKEYGNKKCICIYNENGGNKLHASFYEIREFNAVTFIRTENIDMLGNILFEDDEEVVIYIANNCEKELI